MTVTISKPDTLPTHDLDTIGDQLADDILIGSVQNDKTTNAARNGGTTAKHVQAWSLGGAVD